MPDHSDDAQKPPRRSSALPPLFVPRASRPATPTRTTPVAPRPRLFTPPDVARQPRPSTPHPPAEPPGAPEWPPLAQDAGDAYPSVGFGPSGGEIVEIERAVHEPEEHSQPPESSRRRALDTSHPRTLEGLEVETDWSATSSTPGERLEVESFWGAEQGPAGADELNAALAWPETATPETVPVFPREPDPPLGEALSGVAQELRDTAAPWADPGPGTNASSTDPAHHVAEALERVARRVRAGELALPADARSATDTAALALALAALLKGNPQS